MIYDKLIFFIYNGLILRVLTRHLKKKSNRCFTLADA